MEYKNYIENFTFVYVTAILGALHHLGGSKKVYFVVYNVMLQAFKLQIFVIVFNVS